MVESSLIIEWPVIHTSMIGQIDVTLSNSLSPNNWQHACQHFCVLLSHWSGSNNIRIEIKCAQTRAWRFARKDHSNAVPFNNL